MLCSQFGVYKLSPDIFLKERLISFPLILPPSPLMQNLSRPCYTQRELTCSYSTPGGQLYWWPTYPPLDRTICTHATWNPSHPPPLHAHTTLIKIQSTRVNTQDGVVLIPHEPLVFAKKLFIHTVRGEAST